MRIRKLIDRIFSYDFIRDISEHLRKKIIEWHFDVYLHTEMRITEVSHAFADFTETNATDMIKFLFGILKHHDNLRELFLKFGTQELMGNRDFSLNEREIRMLFFALPDCFTPVKNHYARIAEAVHFGQREFVAATSLMKMSKKRRSVAKDTDDSNERKRRSEAYGDAITDSRKR